METEVSEASMLRAPEIIGEAPFRFRLFVEAARIQREVRRLGRELTLDYVDRRPVLVGVLNGCFLFMADLIRELQIECEVDFVKISSYREGMQAGQIDLMKTTDVSLRGRHVILVEDIVDTGNSLDYLRTHIRSLEPASLAMVAMFVKESALRMNRRPEYSGMEIPDDFVVGYGLDHGGNWRQLPDLYVLIRPEERS